jgi:hypothetical protein
MAKLFFPGERIPPFLYFADSDDSPKFNPPPIPKKIYSASQFQR